VTTPTLSLDAVTLRTRLSGPEAPRMLDVRTPAEFETAHIPGSYNVPLETLREHRAELLGHLDEQVVLVCRSGRIVVLSVLGSVVVPGNRGPRQDISTVLTQVAGSGRAS
jgi:3-mercaptopyruvate sulfurtransferase SseA